MGARFSETQERIATALAALSGQLREIGIGITGLRNVVENNVIAVETRKIPGSGVLERNWQQRFACVTVRNFAAATNVVVTNAPEEAGGIPIAGAEGTGQWIVPGSTKDTINMAGETLTIYGTAGQFVSYQVFTRPQNP